MVPRPRIKHRDLPPHMVRRSGTTKRTGAPWVAYYYDHGLKDGKRKLTPLGTDLSIAKHKWAELEGAPPAPDAGVLKNIFDRWLRDEAKDRAPRTQKDDAVNLAWLRKVFDRQHIDVITPQHVRIYLDKRKAKVRGNREISLFSVIFNKAREWGYTTNQNPVQGVTKNKEIGRKVYVTDAMLALVYKHADAVIRDTMDLAYLTGQRPADVLKMRWDQVKDGAIWIEQGKTKRKLRITVEGDLDDLLARIKARGLVGVTILADPKGQALKPFGYFRSHFNRARDAAAAEALDLNVPFIRFQLRDLRAKAASDLDSMADARKLLGHSTETMTRRYVRERVGEQVSPIRRKA